MQQTKHFLINHVHTMKTRHWKERARESCYEESGTVMKKAVFFCQARLEQCTRLIPKQSSIDFKYSGESVISLDGIGNMH